MKRTLTVLCTSFVFGWVALAGAQTAAQGQSNAGQSMSGSSQSGKSSRSQSKQSRQVKLSGCLSQGAGPNLFVLSNATEIGESSSMGSSSHGSTGMSSSASGTASGREHMGTSGQSGMSGMGHGEKTGIDFQLVAGRNVNLKKYVGQRVEVSGVVEPMKEKGTSGMSSQGTSGQSSSGMSGESGERTAGAITHRVKVNSVKQLASSCQ
jgi:hypothetical protein